MAVIVGLAPPGEREQALLHERHLLDRQLDPQVAAGDHDRVGRVDDLLSVGGGLWLLDLGDERDLDALFAQVLAHGLEVLAPAHEGEREEVEVHLEAGVDERDVLGADRRERDGDVGQVEALARGHAPAHLDSREHVGVVHAVDTQAHGPVGQVEHVACVHELREARPRHGEAGGVALHGLSREDHARVARELSHAAGHWSDAQLGPRQVTEDRHLTTHRLAGGTDRRGGLCMALLRAVGEVEPGDVHTGRDQPLEHGRLGRRRANGGDDLGRAHGTNIPRARLPPQPDRDTFPGSGSRKRGPHEKAALSGRPPRFHVDAQRGSGFSGPRPKGCREVCRERRRRRVGSPTARSGFPPRRVSECLTQRPPGNCVRCISHELRGEV